MAAVGQQWTFPTHLVTVELNRSLAVGRFLSMLLSANMLQSVQLIFFLFQSQNQIFIEVLRSDSVLAVQNQDNVVDLRLNSDKYPVLSL